MLINGQWSSDWHPVQDKDEQGRFERQQSSFRHWIQPAGTQPEESGAFIAEPNRYHLYVAYICPWASRTLMVRKLKQLEDVISISVVNPSLTDQGWQFGGFPGADEDILEGARYLHELYVKADSNYTGRATVPVLWDKKTRTIVNNESSDICRILNSSFNAFGDDTVDLYPEPLQAEIDELNDFIYESLNNGVYKSGFASSQGAYEEANAGVFQTLETLEERLADGRQFLLGDALTEADIRLFVTLIRFDAAYFGLFKCNLKSIREYRFLNEYMRNVYSLPGIDATVRLDHIKAGYYSIKALNPPGIVPMHPNKVEDLFAA